MAALTEAEALPLGRVRVAMLATTLPAEPGDGTPEFVLSLAEHLPAADVAIVAPRSRGCARRQRFGSVEVERFAYAPDRVERLADDAILPTLKNDRLTWLQVPGLLIAMWRAATKRVRRGDVDVIVAHWIIPGGLIARLVGRRHGVPYLVVAHGADAYALNGRATRWLKRLVLRDAGGVHAVSSEIGRRLDALVPGCVTLVEPVGVEITAPPSPPDVRDANRLVFVGRLAEKKGVDVLLEALARVPGPWTLDVVGDGPDRASLEALSTRLGLGHRVRFRGALPHREVDAALGEAALVVVPSRTAGDGDRDGTPVVVMEAMVAGAPIVATALGGIAEVLSDGDTALLVDEADPEALAGAIAASLADPLAAADRAARARQYAEDNLDVVAVAGRLRTELGRVRVSA